MEWEGASKGSKGAPRAISPIEFTCTPVNTTGTPGGATSWVRFSGEFAKNESQSEYGPLILNLGYGANWDISWQPKS